MTQSPTTRSKARFARASAVLPPTTLDAECAKALDRLLVSRGGTVAKLLRELLRDAASRLPGPFDQSSPRC